MSENLNRDFSAYEAMTTEELEEILRLDAEAPEGAQSDTEFILFILEVLASRKNTENITGNKAQKAWESFQENYMPEESEKPAEQKKCAQWVRGLIAAAAVVALLIFIPVSGNAFSLEEVWNVVARWAKETFSFVSGDAQLTEPSPDDEKEYSSLQEMLEEHKRNASIVPARIPDGFTLEEIDKDITPTQEVYTAYYTDGNKELGFQIRTHLSSDSHTSEIENDPIEIYPHEGIDYYIFNNVDQLLVMWVVEPYECLFSGDVTIDEAKIMIDSIRKG